MIKIFYRFKILFFTILFIFINIFLNSCGFLVTALKSPETVEKSQINTTDLVLLKKNRKLTVVAKALNLQNPLFNIPENNENEFQYNGKKFKCLKLKVKAGEYWFYSSTDFNTQVYDGSSWKNKTSSSISVTKNPVATTYNVISDANGLIVDWFTLLEAKNGNTDFDYELIKGYIE